MAYDVTKLDKILDIGFSSPKAVWRYNSSDSAVDIAVTGYFAGAGAGSNPAGSSIPVPGVRIGDVILNQESSGSTNFGRCTLHGVIASTANQASTLSSTGYNTVYNVSVSTHAST
jgi:hypothetical protein